MSYPENHILQTPLQDVWKRIGIYPHHGMVFQLSSLHSKESLGIGEFFDLLPMIDWLSSLGMDVCQLLPLNDSGDDPSPYNLMSSLALSPLYLRLQELPGISLQGPHLKALEQLNHSPRVRFHEVKNHKMALLRDYYHKTYPEFCRNPDYTAFLEEHPWLQEYGFYKALRKHLSYQEIKKLTEKELFPLLKENEEEISFHSFLQYHAFHQLQKVKQYAARKRVLLKGDLPILISPDSVDHFLYKNLFLEGWVAGSPPDFYNPEGQKWNFPILDWDELEKTDYAWWKRRLKAAETFYHLYRIDHVVGFFRIWGIPPEKESKEGDFLSSNRYLWPFQGKDHLRKLVGFSELLPLAEDLGTIPPEVPTTLKSLGICGTKVIRWERYWEEDGSFIPFSAYEPLSMTTVSTHDSETLKEWWEKRPAEAAAYASFRGWKHTKKWSKEIQYRLLEDAHGTPSLFHINLLQEYLALFPPFIHSSSEEERINVPGKVCEENWSYRCLPSVETIVSSPELSLILKGMLRS